MTDGFSRSHEEARRSRSSGLWKTGLRVLRTLPAFVMIVVMVALLQSAPRAGQRSVFRSGTELVLVNVVVRDKSGAVGRNLSRDDFTVTEDDKPHTITNSDFEELAPSQADKSGAASAAQSPSSRLPTDAVGAI